MDQWRSKATATIGETATILGLSRNATYAAAKRGEIPTVRFGGRILVPVIALRSILGELDAFEGVTHEDATI